MTIEIFNRKKGARKTPPLFIPSNRLESSGYVRHKDISVILIVPVVEGQISGDVQAGRNGISSAKDKSVIFSAETGYGQTQGTLGHSNSVSAICVKVNVQVTYTDSERPIFVCCADIPSRNLIVTKPGKL